MKNTTTTTTTTTTATATATATATTEVKTTKTATIIELYETGMDLKEIAANLGIRYQFAYNVVSNYCLKSGLIIRLTKQTNGNKDKIVAMLSAGSSVKEIVAELKVSTNYIYKIKKEMTA